MTVKEEIELRLKGVTSAEIKDLKEREKMEATPKEDPKEEPKENPKEEPKEDPKEEPKEDPKEEPKEDPKEDDLLKDTQNKIAELEKKLKEAQAENLKKDYSGADKDTRTDFEKAVEIFKGGF